MEKTFLILMLLLPVNMNAQMQRFIEPGKTWHVRGQVLYPPCEIEEIYHFTEESDTLVDDVHYMRLFKVGGGEQETSGIFREADGVVYRYYPEHNKEYVFYDFTLVSTGIIAVSWLGSVWDYFCKVTATGSHTLLDGSQVRRIEFGSTLLNTDAHSEDNVWLEGIGNLRHPLLNVENSLRDGLPFYTVMSVTRGGEVLYSHTPAGIADISTAKDADGPAYDIQGRPVPQDTKHGFIIRNGRKMWRK